MSKVNDAESTRLAALGQQMVELVGDYYNGFPAANADLVEMVFLFRPTERTRAEEMYEQLALRWQTKSFPKIMLRALESALRQDG